MRTLRGIALRRVRKNECEVVMENAQQGKIVQLVSELAGGKVFPLRVARAAMIQWALSHTHGNVSQAATQLGTSRGTIYRYARD